MTRGCFSDAAESALRICLVLNRPESKSGSVRNRPSSGRYTGSPAPLNLAEGELSARPTACVVMKADVCFLRYGLERTLHYFFHIDFMPIEAHPQVLTLYDNLERRSSIKKSESGNRIRNDDSGKCLPSIRRLSFRVCMQKNAPAIW